MQMQHTLSTASRDLSWPVQVNDKRVALRVHWAQSLADVRAVQRLRYQVFVEKCADRMSSTVLNQALDAFDPWCEHLLVRRDIDNEVVGTYRVLTPEMARVNGGLHADAQFDLAPLWSLRPHLVELDRACVHPEHRTGGVILALWRALANDMQRRGLQTMIGCVGVRTDDGGHAAASLWRRLNRLHVAPPSMQVRPLVALPVGQLDTSRHADVPPLLKGYLRLGAKLLGPPAWNADLQTAEFPVMLRLADLPARYRRRFIELH